MSVARNLPSLSGRQWQALAYYAVQSQPSAFHSPTDTSLLQRRLIRRANESFGLELTEEGKNVVGNKAAIDEAFVTQMASYSRDEF